MPYVETIVEFRTRMRCECIQGTWQIGPSMSRPGWLFENGAFSDGQMHVDPPTDEVGLAKMRRQYLRHKLREWEQAFSKVKQAAFDAAKFSGREAPTISVVHVEQLEEIQTKVFELRNKIEPLDEILSKSPDAIVQRERKEAEQENYAERSRLVDRVSQIEI